MAVLAFPSRYSRWTWAQSCTLYTPSLPRSWSDRGSVENRSRWWRCSVFDRPEVFSLQPATTRAQSAFGEPVGEDRAPALEIGTLRRRGNLADPLGPAMAVDKGEQGLTALDPDGLVILSLCRIVQSIGGLPEAAPRGEHMVLPLLFHVPA